MRSSEEREVQCVGDGGGALGLVVGVVALFVWVLAVGVYSTVVITFLFVSS